MNKYEQLTAFYLQQQLNAQSAILYGDFVRADYLYHYAFKISVLITQQPKYNQPALDYLLTACLDCLDYCLPCKNRSNNKHDPHSHFIAITVNYLIDLISSNHDKDLRQQALLKFSQLHSSVIDSNLQQHYRELCSVRFATIWSTYAAELINTQ